MRNGIITRNNYEAFFLDFLEGNLTGKEERELFLFVEAHPGLRKQLKEYEEVRLSPPDKLFPEKNLLKRPDPDFESIDDTNVEEAMIAFWEGNLPVQKRTLVEAYVNRHPENKKDFKLYGKVFLTAQNILFDGKKKLVRKSKRRIYVLSGAGTVAAVFLALFGFLFWPGMFKNPDVDVKQQILSNIQHPVSVSSGVEEPLYSSGPVQMASVNTGKQKPEAQPVKRQGRNKRPGKNISSSTIRNKDNAGELLSYCPVIREFALPVAKPVPDLMLDMEKINKTRDENMLTLAEYVSLKIKKNVLKEDTIVTPRLNVRDIMLLGVKGINSLTGLNIRVQKKNNQSEDKEIFALTSRIFSYTRVRPAEKK